MSICRKCGVILDKSNWYPSKQGRDCICSPCAYAGNRKWIINHRDRYNTLLREWNKKWREINPEKSRQNVRKRYNPEKAKEYNKQYGLLHKAEAKTHNTAKYAARKGLLEKQPCEVCGSCKVEMHHADYTKPLSVNWFCRKHHAEHHLNAVSKVQERRKHDRT